jgi:hypothetical protein
MLLKNNGLLFIFGEEINTEKYYFNERDRPTY